MTAQLIEDRITPCDLVDLARATIHGYRKVLGSEFTSANSMAAGFAQLCLESGNGQRAHCWNFHNEKLGSDWDGLFCQFTCDEIFDAQTAARAKALGPCSVSTWKDGPLKRVLLHPPHPWSSFVAFLNADEGAARYIEFLSCRDRYRQAWHALFVGDASGFSHELRRAGYYTADESTYTRGLVSIAARSLPVCEKILAEEAHDFADEDLVRIGELVALTLAETRWEPERHQELAA